MTVYQMIFQSLNTVAYKDIGFEIKCHQYFTSMVMGGPKKKTKEIDTIPY